MDPATAALVFQIQREEEEQVQKEARERLSASVKTKSSPWKLKRVNARSGR
jgi:hypothetical protein